MDKKIVANIKTLGLDMINKAKSGHPGIVLSSAPIIYTLYKYHLNINPINPTWYNRDRFIMSAGHGSALLYSMLYMSGYDLSLDDLKSFRCIDSKTPGHPEYGVTPGVEASTGPLGSGIATAVGVALGSKILKEKSNMGKESFIDFNTYVLVGDGDLMEGVSYEACSLAGTLKLDNLIVLYDSNNMTLDGSTDLTFKENIRDRFEALGFDTFKVTDGNSIKQLNFEISKAKRSKKPAFIEIKTHLGYGSVLQDTNKVHGSPLTEEDLEQLKNKLSIPNEDFYVNEELRRDLIGFIARRVGDKYNKSINLYDEEIKPNLDSKYNDIKFFFDDINYDISTLNWSGVETNKSIREVNKYVINEIAKHFYSIIGGSADLNSSTKAYIDYGDDVTYKNYGARNIWYGIREHASSCISNGLALLNFRPFTSTFLAFSDYLKPGIRMSSLMNLPVIYIFTHDSVTVGKDGPTHQPIEHLTALRDIPNLDVYRPADLKEIIGSWQAILASNRPSALVITRSNEVRLNETSATNTQNGGYVIMDSDDYVATLVSSGSDLITTIKVAYALCKNNIKVRVVSMVSLDLFLNQSQEYQKNILKDKKVIVIESSTALHYAKITDYNNIINITTFGKSGKEEDVLEVLHFDVASIYKKVYHLINK